MTMDSTAPSGGDMQSELALSIEAILEVLRGVSVGDLTQRLDLPYPETHPVGALASSVNSMLDALHDAQTAAARNLQELGEKIETIERQREAIRTLSVPIIEIWTGVLCAPVVGVLDSMRAADVTTSLLTAVVAKKARYAIIDVTGIEVMDTQSCDHFLRMARAVTLLGARCMLSGVNPNIARTIVHMGVDLGGLKSYRSMRDALKICVKESAAKARGGA
jgi:rsbT co-antagonist protein RsbR